MTTVAEFFDEVRAVVKRGNALDANLPHAFTAALSFVESNYNWSYMREVDVESVLATADSLTIADEATKRIKTFQSIGYQLDDGDWVYLRQVDPGDFKSSAGTPAGYILTRAGSNWTLKFDAPWAEDTDLTIYSYKRSIWSGVESDEFWVLDALRTPMLCRAMIYLSPIMRDAAMLQMYQALWLESITQAVTEEGERVQGGR